MSKKKKTPQAVSPVVTTGISDADMKKNLRMAYGFYEADKLDEANTVYRQILDHNPNHAESLYMMGMIAHKIKRFDVAEKLIPMAIVAPGADSPVYYNSLGDVFRDQGKTQLAISAYKKAVDLKPDYMKALNNLGTTYSIERKYKEAFSCYRRILSLDPDHALALYNIGLIYEEQGDVDIAYQHYLKAIAAKPDLAHAYNSAGNILNDARKYDEARTYFERAIHHNKNYWDAYINLGTLLKKGGDIPGAVAIFEAAAALKKNAQVHATIGELYSLLNQDEKSIISYEKAIEIDPDYVPVLNNLGSLYFNLAQYEKSFLYYERALKIDPNYATSLNNFAGLLKNMGKLDEAMDHYRRAVAYAPHSYSAYSNMLLAMIYTASVLPEEIAEASREFGKRFCDSLFRTRPMIRDNRPERKLRIGYVSPDFRSHAVNYFFENLLKNHDRTQYEIFAYSNVRKEDSVTERLKTEFDHWRDIRNKTDDEAADMIEEDKIDILVDLAGHTGDTRLLIFARKPAPIQISWLGYPATTGLKTIDYRITDHYAEPKGTTEHLNVEKLWRLPQIFCCYGANEKNPAVIDHPPFEDNGYITFGCFNNFSKVTDPVLETWRKILLSVPESRILLEIGSAEVPRFQASLDERLNRLQLPKERVMVVPRNGANQFILYNKIDIALDPFPCVGGTTSMDTMWMGVPLITLAGHHFVSRMGVTILTNVGLPEFIAQNTDEYVTKAVALATDRDRLRAIRHKLRDKVIASPMMNQVDFARNMEDAYRDMWRQWCGK